MHFYIIVDLLKYGLNKSEFDICSQVDCHNENSDEISQRYVENLHELIYHLYMIYDLVNLCKILTSFKVLQFFNNFRMSNLNRWFDFVKYTKLTTNLDDLRTCLLASLTIGMPNYTISLSQDAFSIDSVNNQSRPKFSSMSEEDLPNEINVENSNFFEPESKINPVKSETNLVSSNTNNHDFNDQSNSLLQTVYKNLNKKTSSHSFVALGNVNRVYEHFLDKLLDLNMISRVEASPLKQQQQSQKESLNMHLINRTILLIDVAKNLEDKYFQEVYLSMLCDIVNKIIIDVRCWNFFIQ
jgi:hypothetical protein